MAKFQKGDRVIVPPHKVPEAFFEKTATVIRYNVYEDNRVELEFDAEITSNGSTRKNWVALEHEVELLEVYNSPLYKALS